MSVTNWVGTTTDASLGSNWSNGLPDDATVDAILDDTSVKNLATGFGAVRARATLAGALQPSDGDTITFDQGGTDEQTYQFLATPLAANDINIGGTVLETHQNLAAAVDGTGVGDGSDYYAGTSPCSTIVNFSTSATQSVYAAADGGTGGNSLSVADNSVNWGWTGGTPSNMSGGAADSATMGNVYVESGYTGDIHTTGTKAKLNCGLFFHRGLGSMFLDIVGVTRLIVDSPNYAIAADLIMSSSLTALEIIRGRCKFHAPSGTSMPNQIIVSDTRGRAENLRLTGDSTLTGAQLIIAPGIVSVDGPDWTAIDNFGGKLTIENGAVTALRTTGLSILKADDTMADAYVMGGDFDLTQGQVAKTVTDVWLAPQARFHRRDDIDSYTLREIGRA